MEEIGLEGVGIVIEVAVGKMVIEVEVGDMDIEVVRSNIHILKYANHAGL